MEMVAPAGVAYTGVEVFGLHFVLLNRRGVRHVGNALGTIAHVGHAIDRPVIIQAADIVRVRGPAERVDAVVAAIVARLNRGRELDQHQRAVIENRDVEHVAVVHHAAGIGAAAGIDQRGLGCDRDIFRGLANLKIDIDLGPRANGQFDAGASRLLETGHLRDHPVVTGHKKIGLVITGVVRR